MDDTGRPLADRMRPQTVDDVVGQIHLLAAEKPLRKALESDKLHSCVFWGPPGTGKTSLARLLAHASGARFVQLSAVLSGVADIRKAVVEARKARNEDGVGTVLFVDEVHRFNKSQQDAFLPHVEDGTFVFIGATTENPSFELNNALLSRVRVYVLKSLTSDELESVLRNALSSAELGLGERCLQIDNDDLRRIAVASDGDARRALNLIEAAADLCQDNRIDSELVRDLLSGQLRRFDKGGEAFYDQISALHKSIRGSSPDAALYWTARMIDGGCDPLYIARRLIRAASEDIGNADPRALELVLNAVNVQERLGSPEGELAIAHAVVYLACAPKSNAVYNAWNSAVKDAKNSGSLEVPLHLRNAPTKLMKEMGYGKRYRYAHDEPGGYAAGETYFPEELSGRRYYQPVDRGLEIRIKEKLERLRTLDAESS